MTHRRGFALLAVLWIVVALGALTTSALAGARQGSAASARHVSWLRGYWAAEACLASATARALAAPGDRPLEQLLSQRESLTLANGARCDLVAGDPGERINRDSTPELLPRLDSLLAWSGDTSAERRRSLLTRYGDGRINLARAPALVIAALPGMTADAERVISGARTWGRPLRDLDDLMGRLSPTARNSLVAVWPELVGLAAFRTTAVVVTARGWTDDGTAPAVIEVVLVSGGGRFATARRRVA